MNNSVQISNNSNSDNNNSDDTISLISDVPPSTNDDFPAERLSFINKYYPNISIENDWNDYKWQIRNSITTIKELLQFDINFIAKNIECNENLHLRITPYYLSVIINNKNLLKTVIPTYNELIVSDGEDVDPLHETVGIDNNIPKTIVHRYPDRVLFLVTDFCSVNCRFCTRSRMVNKDNINLDDINNGINYIKNHKEVRDVLISGGDVLTLSDNKIEFLLSEIKKIDHVKFIRIGTKVPVVLPQRINSSLLAILRKYRPWINIHFTHPNEITEEVANVCSELSLNGCTLGSQTVLLKDVNNDIDIIKPLMQKLTESFVRPYYIFSADKVIGTKHFRCSVEEGVNIISQLRGFTSGVCVPSFIVDSKLGKIQLIKDPIISKDCDKYTFRNYKGEEIVVSD